jgi:hypothetical protein
MNVRAIRVEKAPVAKNEIKNWVAISVRRCWVPTEYIVNLPSVVLAAGHLAITVVAGLAPGIGKPFDLEPFGELNETEVGISVAAGEVIEEADDIHPTLEPILEMKLLVIATLALNQLSSANGLNTLFENGKDARHFDDDRAVMKAP